MLIANFNLTTPQISVLIAFRHHPDTREAGHHPMHDVDHTVTVLSKLCRDGYLLWHAGDVEAKRRPGYTLTPRGEMILKLVEDELRRTLAWFDRPGEIPKSSIQGAQHDHALGKREPNRAGRLVGVKKKSA